MLALTSLLPLLGAIAFLVQADARPHARDANSDLKALLKSNLTRGAFPNAPSMQLKTIPAPTRNQKRDIPLGWTYQGCYYDPGALNGASGGSMMPAFWGVSAAITVELCLNYCQKIGFTYGGLSPVGYCHCDNSIHTGSYGLISAISGNYGSQVDSSYCNTPCTANTAETCGGSLGAAFSVWYGPNAAAVQAAAASSAAASSSSSVAAAASSASAYSSSVSAYSSSASAYSSSASAYSASSSASAYSASVSAASSSASAYSASVSASASKASSLAASASAYSAASISSASSVASASSASSVASAASAASLANSIAQSAASYSASVTAAASKASSLSAYSSSVSSVSSASSAASAAAAASSSASIFSATSIAAALQSSLSASAASVSSAAAAASSSASVFSATSAAAALQSSIAASAAAYSSSVSAANASSVAASVSKSLSASASAFSASVSAYSASVSSAASVASASQSALAASIAASASSVASAASSSAAAYSSSVSAAIASASAANALSVANSIAASASSYSASVSASASAYAASVSAAIASAAAANASSIAAAASSSLSASAAAYSASVSSVASAASSSAAAYSSSVSAAIASASAANASSVAAAAAAAATASAMAASSSASLAAYSASSAKAYSSSSLAAYASSSAAAASAAASASASIASASASASSASAAAAAASSSVAAAAAAATGLPSGWIYSTVGVAEGTSGRALNGPSISTPDMTPAKCANYCTSQGYPIAGTEYSTQCFCGNYLTNGASLNITSSQCNMACGGFSNATCGGPNCLSLTYSSSGVSGLASDLTQGAPALPGGWAAASTACVQEGTSGRALVGASTSSNSMTAASCISYCNSQGFPIAGTEYGGQCFCGAALTNGASLNIASTQCNMACSGAGSQICGGPNALNIYVSSSGLNNLNADLTAKAVTLPSGWAAASATCIQEGTSGRALAAASWSSDTMTPTACINYCQSQGYSLAGVEYSTQCFCGPTLANGASLTKTSSACWMTCGGDGTQICGGPSALNLYVSTAALSSLSSDLTTAVVSLPSGWSAASTACVAEGTSGRALTGASTSSSSMTPGTCASYCTSQGFQYAGVEYGSECYCGNSFSNGASLTKPSSSCNMACSGAAGGICGGPNALSVYVNPSLAPAAQTPAAPTVVNGFTAQGCIQEVVGRALTGAVTTSPFMTIEMCTSFCSSKGFSVAGLEYASECYCGNSLTNGGSMSLTSGQCYMTCSGNANENCGGPDAINLFSVTPMV